MSSRVKAIIPAGAGLTPSRRSTRVRRVLEHPHDGANTRESTSIGTASASASLSAFCSATALGTSSPSTTLRYVRTANEITKATPRGRKSKYRETSGSPIAPRAIPKTVIPTWTVEMNRTGSSISLERGARGTVPVGGALLEPVRAAP